MADRESVVVTGVLAALCACLVGCGDSSSPVTGPSHVESQKAAVAEVDLVAVAHTSQDGPKIGIDDMVLHIGRIGGYGSIVVTGERAVEVEFPDALVPVPNEAGLQDGSPGSPRLYQPGEVDVIKPGEALRIQWRRSADQQERIHAINVESVAPGVYAERPADSVEGVEQEGTAADEPAVLKQIGKILYWEEHRTRTNALAGFELAFQIKGTLMLDSLPTFSPRGVVIWHPLMDLATAQEFNLVGYSRDDFKPLLHYEQITSEPGNGIVMKGSNPECSIQVSMEDERTVVRLSMRSWPQKLDAELMRIEFSPFSTSEPNKQSMPQLDVYLPKSPFKAEGFELPEFQEAAQSE